MTTPNRNMIHAKALELWRNDRLRNGQPYELTPEESELREEGYFVTAQQILMFEDNQHKTYSEQFSDLDKSDSSVTIDTLSEQLRPQPFSIDVHELMKTGVFLTGTRQCGKSNLAKLIVQKLISEGITVFIVDPTTVWLDYGLPVLTIIEPQGKQLITWQQRNMVFDTSQLSPILQQKFIELFNTAVFIHAVETPKPLRQRTVIVYEESHTSMENNRLNAKQFQNTKRIITQGANFEISFIGISQFPALVDKLPLKAAQQRYFGKTSEPNDIKYLKAYLGENVKQLPSLPLGQFLYMHSGRLNRIATVKYEENQSTEGSKFAYAYTS